MNDKFTLVLDALGILIMAAFLFIAGQKYGKYEAEKWCAAPPLVIQAPAVPATWQLALACPEAGICLGSESYRVNDGWFFCGISVDPATKTMWGNGATCPEVAKRLKGKP